MIKRLRERRRLTQQQVADRIGVSCCGIVLPPLEAESADEDHDVIIERVEDEYYVHLDHEMSKTHYISFIMATSEQPILWRVLARDEDSLLVIADTYIASLPYHSESEDTSWETCELRQWLNKAFMPLSFTAAERQRILPSEVKARASRRFGTEAGNDTRDFLYIPDLEEISALMPSEENRSTGSWWWLRTPGCYREFAACVAPDGRLVPIGNFADSVYGVRPLMRISTT